MINKIKELLLTKPDPVIAIDGSCASGKTTLAKNLAGQFGMQIIHMDEFFLLPAMRTEERLSKAGGNIHYERFIDEVVSGIKSGKEFSYRIFSCKKGDFDGTNIINPRKPIIIEGAYALHPEIPDIYDLKIFLDADTETRLERIRKRNGADALEIFKTKRIPLENRYFDTFGISDKCNIVIK